MEQENRTALPEEAFWSGLPVGLLRCTCEKYPKVLWANEQFFRFLGTTPDSEDWRELFRENVFFMLPFEERRAFRACLEAAERSAEPVCAEHRVIHCDGGHTHLAGWLRRVDTPEGEREYHAAYLALPRERATPEQRREQALRQALYEAYEVVYEVDRVQRTMECVHRKPGSLFPTLFSVRVILDSMTGLNIFDFVQEEDREKARTFVWDLFRQGRELSPEASRVRFRVPDGERVRTYQAAAAELDGRTALICCRELAPSAPAPMPKAAGRSRVFIRTFGYFDVFVDGRPVIFRSEKSKELFAVLVDRCGSFVANPYIISCLWEDEPYSDKVQGRCRQTAYRMAQTLKEYGIADIVERVDGRRRIVPERVECDYFDYLNGGRDAGRKFNGAYMSDYSWGEITLSSLLKDNAAARVDAG